MSGAQSFPTQEDFDVYYTKDVEESSRDTKTELLGKSKESFLLAIELYNRPSLKFSAEACAIFLCNAWELMIKAYMIKRDGEDSIFYSDDPGRTLSLEACLKRVFTNESDPLRKNMKEVIDFRNLSTHFITDEYEFFYGPFLQSCVENFADKLESLHGESIVDIMPQNRLHLAVRGSFPDEDEIRAKYHPSVASKLLEKASRVQDVIGDEGNRRLASRWVSQLQITKKASDADLKVRIGSDAEDGIAIVESVKHPRTLYPHTRKSALKEINKQLKRRGIDVYYRGEKKDSFNSFHWDTFVKAYQMKENDKFSYDRRAQGEPQPSYIFSQVAIQFIVDRMSENPMNCIDDLRVRIEK